MAVRFDRTVTLGNILVALSMAAALLLSWAQMGSRLDFIEVSMNQQQRVSESQAESIRLLSLNVKQLSTLAEIYIPKIEELSRERKGR